MAIATVRTVLMNAAPVVALVPADRIEALRRTQGFDIPAITLQRISLAPFNHLRGDGGLDSNLVQLDVWSSNYTQARSIADECRTVLDASGFTLQSESDGGYESETDPELYRVTQSWSVFTS